MKLRTGYLISGLATGIIFFFSFLWSLPDGRLHLVFCDVGQGDAAYVRFPDGRDMVVDGGPNTKVMDCLGRHMPFWDRSIDLVVMTHPQKDHMQGLIEVFKRFDVAYFVRSDIANTTQGYVQLMDVVREKKIPQQFMVQGDEITIGTTSLSFLWPSEMQIAKGSRARVTATDRSDVLGATVGDLNDYSLVFRLRYGSFDVVFTGDADTRVESGYRRFPLADEVIEVLKVPHHGSKTGISEQFVVRLDPELAVISLGKNSYGHPSKNIVDILHSRGSRVLRTDERGDISVISDGQKWWVEE